MLHTIGTYAIYAVSAFFLLGMAGSAVVILFSFFDDFTELFTDEETESLPLRPPTA